MFWIIRFVWALIFLPVIGVSVFVFCIVVKVLVEIGVAIQTYIKEAIYFANGVKNE